MTSTQVQNRLREIVQEDDTRDKVSKFLLVKPSIRPTSEVKSNRGIATSRTVKVFKKSKLLVFGGLFLISMLWFAIFFAIAKQKDLNQGGLGVIMFMTFFMTISVLWQLFYSDELNFTLYIDENGIQVDDKVFPWSQIAETAILNYVGRGEGTSKLVILLIDNEYWKFNLTNFYSVWGIGKTVSNYIEYFKAKQSLNKYLPQ